MVVNLKKLQQSNESIFIQIDDKDLVALEVKYHKQCYEKYTCKSFPQLVFDKPKVGNKSELIVYAGCLSQASVAESFMDDDIETSQSSQESESDDDIGTKASMYSTQVQD